MSFKDVLATKRKSPAAIFHKSRVDSPIHRRDHIFVEGYDDVTFYSRHARYLQGVPPRFHICFGKKNLDDVAKLYWNSDISNALALFIRDSDFDVYLGRSISGPDYQLTYGYAVENYVCTPETLRRYFREAFCLDDSEVDLEVFLNDHTRLSNDFHNWLSPIYGAAMYAIRDGRHCDLNKLKTDDHFAVLQQGGLLPEPSTLDEIASIGLRATDFNEESYKLGREYSDLPAVQWMRGKFILTATTLFLRNAEISLRLKHKIGSITCFNRKVSANMTEPAIFDRLCAMAPPPIGLTSRPQFQLL